VERHRRALACGRLIGYGHHRQAVRVHEFPRGVGGAGVGSQQGSVQVGKVPRDALGRGGHDDLHGLRVVVAEDGDGEVRRRTRRSRLGGHEAR